MARNFHSASNIISGTLHNHGLSLTGNSFQGSYLHFDNSSGANTELDCRKALFLTNPVDDHHEVESEKPSLVRKACEWILNNASFQSWFHHDTEPQLLWISGGSGMGKTMMALFLLDELEKNEALRGAPNDVLLFYFLDTRNEKRNTAVTLLRGLIYLLLQARPALLSHILPDFEIQKEGLFAPTSFEALWRIFASMLRDPAIGTVRCLIDGLDECQEASLVRLLRKITILFGQEQHAHRKSRMEGARLKMILISREAPACILNNLASFPRIDISTAPTGGKVRKTIVNQEKGTTVTKTTTTSLGDSSQPQRRLANIVRLAMQERKASLEAETANAQRIDGHTTPQPALEHGFASLSLEESASPPPLNHTGHGAASQQTAADQYTFDPPVEDEDTDESQDPFADPSNDQESETHVQWVIQSHVEAQDDEEETETGQGSLEHYINARVAELSREMGYDESVAAMVDAGLRSRGDGTFLWVNLAVDEIKRHPVSQLEDVVDQLLPGIDNMYCRTLLQIPPSLVPLAAALLRWVIAAQRPMYLSELSAALTLMGFHSSDPPEMVRQGIAACGALLSLTEDETVQIPHLSVEDFLTARSGPLWSDASLSQFYVDTAQVDGEIASFCIRYLEQGCLNAGWVSGEVDDQAKAQRRVAEFPFLVYAVMFWPDHLRTASHPQVDLSSPFFQSNSAIRKSWWFTYYNWTSKKSFYWVPHNFNLLHLAAYVNIPYIAQQMELAGTLAPRLDSKDSDGYSPLAIAASAGNTETFIFLFERGASQERVGGEDVFRLACEKGQAQIVNYLLDKGYDVNKIYDPSNKELFKAVLSFARRPLGVVKECQALEKDHWSLLTSPSDCGDTGLDLACIFGHASVAELLLRRGADISIAGKTGWTALHAAAWMGQLECVVILLQHGADVLVATDDGLNALHCAASRGKTSVVSLFLEQGVEVDGLTIKEKTALHLAAATGGPETIKVLVAAGASTEALSQKGETPLHVAARRGNPKAVEALLAMGADPHAINMEGKSPGEMLKGIKSLTEEQKEALRILETFGTTGSMTSESYREASEAPAATTMSPTTGAGSPSPGLLSPTSTLTSSSPSNSLPGYSTSANQGHSPPHESWQNPHQSYSGSSAYSPGAYSSPPSQFAAGPRLYEPAPATVYQYPGQQQTQQHYGQVLPPPFSYTPGMGGQQGNAGMGTYLQPPPQVPSTVQKRKSLLSLRGLSERAERLLK
ncbi:NACHT and Ankyrin domain-containing protein [Colletotrichum tabaci]|uniref:NACHT and Ankyrin domain-containing protein n=1 Tax=Colletotrichum tabaci TaxID=1209068 RepID=A0AAV9TJF7_9PEZI